MKEIKDNNGVSLAYINLAELREREGKYHTSIEYAERGLDFAKKTLNLNLQKKSYEILSSVNNSLKYYQSSYENFKLYKFISDSIYKRNTSKQISDIQIKYEIEKQERERALQKDSYDKQRVYLNTTLILVLGMIIVIIFTLRSNSKKRELNQELVKAMKNVKSLKGLLPICAECKKIRGDSGYWTQVEDYLSSHSDAKFSHSLCPECTKKLYPKHKTNHKKEIKT